MVERRGMGGGVFRMEVSIREDPVSVCVVLLTQMLENNAWR